MRGTTSKMLRQWCAAVSADPKVAKRAWNKIPRNQRWDKVTILNTIYNHRVNQAPRQGRV